MPYDNFLHTDLTRQIISCAYAVHRILGHGFLESVYEKALALELEKQGLDAQMQYPIGVFYLGIQIGKYKADAFVEGKVIVEIKAVEELHPQHEVQLVNYLKATNVKVGLLLNFGEELSIKRKVFTNPNYSSSK